MVILYAYYTSNPEENTNKEVVRAEKYSKNRDRIYAGMAAGHLTAAMFMPCSNPEQVLQ